MRFMVHAASFLLFVPVFSLAADELSWTKVTTQNFELYTTAGEKNGRETILRFEQVRGFFAQSMNLVRPTDKPVRIITFRSKKESAPYRGNESTAAYYLAGQDRDWIVICGARDEQAYPVAVHEYMHLLVRHSGMEPPLWFNEGLAEVFSTLRPYGGKVAVGGVPLGRYRLLEHSKWLDLGTLLSLTRGSPHYNEKGRIGVFHSQSWALTHMLYLSIEYRPKFPEFLQALAQGTPGANAFQDVYGKSLEQVTRDLHMYLYGDRMRVTMFDVKLEKSAEQPQTRPAPPLESGLILAEILTSMRKSDEARAMLESLATQHPQEPGAFEGLAYLDLKERNWERATASFKRAAELGATNPQFYYDYAMTLRRGGEPAAGIPILQKAVHLQPDFVEAQLSLGLALLNEGRHVEALGALSGIKRVKQEQAVSLYRALAYAQHRLGNDEAAASTLQLAAKYARTAEEKSDVESLRQGISRVRESGGAVAVRLPETEAGAIDSPRKVERTKEQTEEVPAGLAQYDPVLPGAQVIEGVLHQLHCSGKTAKLTILVKGEEQAFLIDDPAKVVVKHSGNASIDFACGRQKPTPVLVRYLAEPADTSDVLGLVRGIEVVEGE